MEHLHQQTTGEIKSLRRCINDLVSILALPAIWTGGDSTGVVQTLLETLLRMLSLDFVFVLLNEMEEPNEFIRVSESLELDFSPPEICDLVKSWLGESSQKLSRFAKKPIGDGDFSIVALPLGLQGELGMIVAGARRPEFPEQNERLVLEVATNQALIGLQEARHLREQKRIANELEQRVAQRTNDLSATNEALKNEIAERKQAEEALGESERMSGLIVDNIPGFVALLAATGEVEFANRQLLEYFGQTLEELKHWGSNDTVHPDDLPNVIEVFMRSIMSGSPYEIAQRFKGSDGIYRWFRNNGSPLRGIDGKITRWCVLLTDIHEQKCAEESLQNSERNLKLIINTIPALAWSARPDGTADFFNRHYLDFIGLTSEQANDWGWAIAVHPDDLDSLSTVWQGIMASEQPGETEARLRRYDGEYRWFLFRVNPLLDESGNIVKWYGTNIDIEDLKRAEDELRRSEAFLAEGQHLASLGNFSWRIDTEEIIWSEQIYRIFEFEPGTPLTLELIGSRVHPEDMILLFDMVERAHSGLSDFEYEHRLLMPDGSIKYVHLIAHKTQDQREQLEYIGAVQDITQRRFSEDALSKASSELARVARVMSLGVLTASITHEVNQPLSGIITNASTCVRMLDADPPNVDGARETARRTIRDGNRASDVIKRLHTLFTKKDFTAETVDLNEAAQEVVALSRSELQRNQVILQVELAKELPPVAGDRVQLQQVILNFILNAMDAMSNIDDRSKQLTIKTELDGTDRVRLSAIDVGIGLAPHKTEKLFDAFYTTKKSGMGIGLSVSRSIIERHQGRLWAVPNKEQGAVFSFSIPVQERSSDNCTTVSFDKFDEQIIKNI